MLNDSVNANASHRAQTASDDTEIACVNDNIDDNANDNDNTNDNANASDQYLQMQMEKLHFIKAASNKYHKELLTSWHL